MNVFTARCIQYAALAVMIVLFLVGVPNTNYTIIGIGALIGLAGVIVWTIFGICPECGKALGRNLPKHCPHCGAKIE